MPDNLCRSLGDRPMRIGLPRGRGAECAGIDIRQANGGFGLPESLVGIALLSLMLTVTGPILSQVIQQFELRGACQQVFTELQEARMAALAENRRHRWEVVDGQTYQVSRYDAVLDEWSVVRTTDISDDARYVTLASETPIIFTPNGSAVSSGSIGLTNARGKSLTVTVRTNGSVSIQ